MAKHTKEKTLGESWGALLRTIWDLKLPWLTIGVSLALKLTEATLLLKLPVTTSSLLSGNITGKARTEATLYYVLTGVISVASVAGVAWSQASSVRCTRDRLWRKMLGMRMNFFDRNDPTTQMSAITNDSSAALDLVNIIQNLLPAIYYVAGAMITISGYHWAMAVSCFALFPLKYLYAFIMGRAFQKSNARLYQRIGVLTGFLADRIAHLSLTKTYTNEVEEESRGKEACQQLLKADMRIVHQDNIAIAVTSVMDILQKFAVVVVAVVLLRNGEIDLVTWLIVISVGISVAEGLLNLDVAQMTGEIIEGTQNAINGTKLMDYISLTVATAVLSIAANYFCRKMELTITLRVRMKLWRKIMHLPTSYYAEDNGNELVIRVTSDALAPASLFDTAVICVTSVITVVEAFSRLYETNVTLVNYSLLMVPVIMAAFGLYSFFQFRLGVYSTRVTAGSMGYLAERVRNFRLIKSAVMEKAEAKRGSSTFKQMYLADFFTWLTIAAFQIISSLSSIVFIVIVFVIGGRLVPQGVLTVGDLTGFYMITSVVGMHLGLFFLEW